MAVNAARVLTRYRRMVFLTLFLTLDLAMFGGFVRLTQGKEMGRIERVWLITDNEPLETMLIREYDGTHMIRVDPALVRSWLPTEQNTGPQNHIYVIDPLGNLMMRFPENADPSKLRKDLGKLLFASQIG